MIRLWLVWVCSRLPPCCARGGSPLCTRALPAPRPRHGMERRYRTRRRRSSLLCILLLALILCETIAAQAQHTGERRPRIRNSDSTRSRTSAGPSEHGRRLQASTDSSSASNAVAESSSAVAEMVSPSSSSTGASSASVCASQYAGTDSSDGRSCICNHGFSGPLCSVVSTDWIRVGLTIAPLDTSDPSLIDPRAHALLANIESSVAGTTNRTRMVKFWASQQVDNWYGALVLFSADPAGEVTAEQLFDRFYAQSQDSSSALRQTELGRYIATVSMVVCPRGSCPDGQQADMFGTPDPTPAAANDSTDKLDLRWFLPVVIGGGVLLVMLVAIGLHYRKRSAEAKAAALPPPAAAVAMHFSKHPHPATKDLVSQSGGSRNGGSVGGGATAVARVSRSGGEPSHHYDTTLAAAHREKSLSVRWLELAGAQVAGAGNLPPRPGLKNTSSPAVVSRSMAGQQPPPQRINSSNNSPITSRLGTPQVPVRNLGLQPHGSGISVTELGSTPSPVHSTVPQRSDGHHSDGQHSDGQRSDGSRSSQQQHQQIPRAPVRIHLPDADNQV